MKPEDQFTMAHNVLNQIDSLLAEAGYQQDSSVRLKLKIAKSIFREAEKAPLSAIEAPPGYRTGKRKLVYNKITKKIEVVAEGGFVVDQFDPPKESDAFDR